MRALALLGLLWAAQAEAAAVASGRNWRVAIDGIECEALLVIRARVHFLGPKGAVEAPVIRLTDAAGRRHLPKSVALSPGSRPLAEWLSAGGLRNLDSESLGEIQLKFEVSDATGALQFEFGDIRGFALTREPAAGKGVCESLLRPEQMRGARAARPAPVDKSKLGAPVHRARYPCRPPSRIVAAEYPPYLPRQLLLFGRGFLPNAREIELPMGRAAAQPYSYTGPDNLVAVEDAARRALLADFPGYRGSRYFLFNWGTQKAASGNEMYSIGIYDLRPCPPAEKARAPEGALGEPKASKP
jgi:hypothetical protein